MSCDLAGVGTTAERDAIGKKENGIKWFNTDTGNVEIYYRGNNSWYTYDEGVGGSSDVSLSSSEEHIGQTGGSISEVSTEFTRPANTTAYAANEVVGPAVTANLTFANVARISGGSGYIVGAELWTNKITITAEHRLHLYHTAPIAIADNAAYPALYADRAKYIGHVDFPAMITEGTGSTAARSWNYDFRLPFDLPDGIDDMIGILETIDAYTPDSGQQYYILLKTDRN